MSDNKLVVDIFGESYPLKVTSDPEYVKKLAKIVDGEMRTIAKRTRSFSNTRIGVLAALEIADSYLQMKKDYEELAALIEKKNKPDKSGGKPSEAMI